MSAITDMMKNGFKQHEITTECKVEGKFITITVKDSKYKAWYSYALDDSGEMKYSGDELTPTRTDDGGFVYPTIITDDGYHLENFLEFISSITDALVIRKILLDIKDYCAANRREVHPWRAAELSAWISNKYEEGLHHFWP